MDAKETIATVLINRLDDEATELRFALRQLVERITMDDPPSFNHDSDADMAALRRAAIALG